MSESLAQVARLVERETGMVIGKAQRSALTAAVGRIAPGMEAERLLAEMAAGTRRVALMTALVDEVTVQESYFFREFSELEAIEWGRLLEEARASGAGAVRVWVAACATGEEAYSLAILADEVLGPDATSVRILATDISASALSRAKAARYSARSMRNLSRAQRNRYFERDGDRYVLQASLKERVHFRRHNLVSDPSPPLGEVVFDVIGCRNLFIYLDPATAARVLDSLQSAVRPGGHLILGAADRLFGTAGRLDALDLGLGKAHESRVPEPVLRRPLGHDPRFSTGDSSLEQALHAANEGDLERTLAIIEELLASEPLNAEAYLVRGLAELQLGDAEAAVASFRRALYIDASFGVAAFQLGRAHDALDSSRAARLAYERACRTLDPDRDSHGLLLAGVDLGDIAAACRARLVDASVERSA